MSVNHFPYLSILTNPEKQSPYPDGDPDCHQNLIVCSLAHCQLPWKFYANPFGSFCAKLLTDRQTGNDDYISSLAEVKTFLSSAVYALYGVAYFWLFVALFVLKWSALSRARNF